MRKKFFQFKENLSLTIVITQISIGSLIEFSTSPEGAGFTQAHSQITIRIFLSFLSF